MTSVGAGGGGDLVLPGKKTTNVTHEPRVSIQTGTVEGLTKALNYLSNRIVIRIHRSRRVLSKKVDNLTTHCQQWLSLILA